MTRHFSMAAIAIIIAVGAVVSYHYLGSPDALNFSWAHAADATPIVANAILAIRAKRDDLKTRAEAKLAELTDDLAEADARRIETEHDEIVRQLDAANAELEAAEAEERAAPTRRTQEPKADAAAVRAAVEADRKRQAAIRKLGAQFKMDPDFIERHAAAETTVDQFRAVVLDKLASADSAGPKGTGSVEVTTDEAEAKRLAMTDAIASRMAISGGHKINVPEHARGYMNMSVVEVAAECVGYRGLLRTGRQVSEVLERAFSNRSFVGMSTSDFPAIFLDAMNKRLLARYQAAAPTYRRFSAPYTAVDFRAMNVIRAGDFPALQPLGEMGEIKSGKFGESKEQFKVAPYAVRLNISRTMIVNDDLGAIDQILGSAGIRVADWENAKAFEKLLLNSSAGPTLLTDAKAVFHVDHGNLAGAGTAITIAAVGSGRAAMMKQTTLDGIKANFTPSTILTGPDKQTEAEQLLTTITPALIANAVPEGLRRLQPVADANVTGNAWYLFADPAVAPTFVYGYLEGFEGPRLSSQEEFGVQGLSAKLEHDFGVEAIDYRGAYRNPGA